MFNSITRILTVAIDISWNAPTFTNGRILNYNVLIVNTDNNNIVYNYNNSIQLLLVSATVMVIPYTNYSVIVSASTIVGEGEETTIIVLSPEAGTECLYPIT